MRHSPSGKNLLRAAMLVPLGMIVFSASASASTTLPPRKPGFWVTTMTMKMSINGQTIGGPPTLSAMCTDAQTDAFEMKRMSGANGHCSHFDIEGAGNIYTMTGSCTGPAGGTMTVHSTVTVKSDTAMHMVSDTTGPQMSGHMSADSKWTGQCPSGFVPGDIAHMQNGQFVKTINILNPPPTAAAP